MARVLMLSGQQPAADPGVRSHPARPEHMSASLELIFRIGSSVYPCPCRPCSFICLLICQAIIIMSPVVASLCLSRIASPWEENWTYCRNGSMESVLWRANWIQCGRFGGISLTLLWIERMRIPNSNPAAEAAAKDTSVCVGHYAGCLVGCFIVNHIGEIMLAFLSWNP